jgi:hypothetical protein
MAVTKIADVVVPDIFAEYLMEPILIKNALFDSGIVMFDALLASKLDRGGDDFKFPYWGAMDSDVLTVPTEDGTGIVNKITSKTLTVARQFREYNAAATAMASILAGSNAMSAIKERVVQVWKTGIQATTVATLTGILNTAGGALVVNDAANVSGVDPTVANNISPEAIIDAEALLGDQGGAFNAMLIHSKVLAELKKLNLIDFEPVADQAQDIMFYQGMRVIVDDALYNFDRPQVAGNATVYTTFLLKGAAFKYGDSENGFDPVFVDNDRTVGLGVETLYTAKMFALAPMGFDFIGTPAGDAGPTDVELAVDTNWELKFNSNTMGFVALYTNAV